MSQVKSLFDKLWDGHLVQAQTDTTPALLYIDLHLVHEVTSPQGFDELNRHKLGVRRSDKTLATLDHAIPTLAGTPRPYVTDQARKQVQLLRDNCRAHNIELHDWDSPHRGIVHVMAPELGAVQPGMTVVCGDSHTATHGAFGALAFGIGSTEVGHVLAAQTLLQRKPKSMRITIDGKLGNSVSAKDIILHIIMTLGVNGATGHVIEYAGSCIRSLDMESRMTICNMSIEAGARAGMIAADETTLDYLRGREKVPKAQEFEQACSRWRYFCSDAGARFDRELKIDASDIRPTITYGTDPGMSIAIDQVVPTVSNATQQRALEYMSVNSNRSMIGKPVDVVFIGSCTNARISDLRQAAKLIRGKYIADNVRMLVVPGSESVRRQAESEGLDQVFIAAGAEWRLPGCSMCIAMNGDVVPPGKTAVSTSNRNFEGRQGIGSRTILASPATATACAIKGVVTDPRQLECAMEVA